MIPFQNILFSKEFLSCNVCFGSFTKIKKGSGTGFWCTFSAWFFHKNVPYLILYQWPKFQCHTFPLSQDIKQNVLWSSYLDSWWHQNLQDLSWIKLSSNGWQGRKIEEGGNVKIWISQEWKELSRWDKKYLS